MPLTTRERISSRTLLEALDTADLLSLAGTVTKKKSTACTRAEAIDTILQNSLSAYELLNRRKVLRDIIVVYLKNEGVPIPPKITKADVVLKTLGYWNEQGSCIPGISSSVTQKQKATSPDRFVWFDYNAWPIGLSAQERVGCRKVLKSLDLLAISSLAGTVSKKKSRACTSAEEIDIILEKSKSAYELLNRKKVLCNAIAAYLKNEGVPIPSNISKAEVVRRALVYWNELTAPHVPTSSELQIKQQSAHAEAKSEKVGATPCPGIKRNKRISQPPTVHQSAHDKRNTTVEKEEEDTSWIWTVSLNGSKPFSTFSSSNIHTAEE